MEHRATPEVNPGKRLSRLEARREKLLVIIERAQRRFEKHDKASRRALKDLASYERMRRRLDKIIAKAKAEVADALIEPAIPAPDIGKLYVEASEAAAAAKTEIAMDDPNHPDLVAARELLAGVNGKPKPKRQRKPKAPTGYDVNKPTDIPLSEFLGNPSVPEDREARMKSLGFRKTKSRST